MVVIVVVVVGVVVVSVVVVVAAVVVGGGGGGGEGRGGEGRVAEPRRRADAPRRAAKPPRRAAARHAAKPPRRHAATQRRAAPPHYCGAELSSSTATPCCAAPRCAAEPPRCRAATPRREPRAAAQLFIADQLWECGPGVGGDERTCGFATRERCTCQARGRGLGVVKRARRRCSLMSPRRVIGCKTCESPAEFGTSAPAQPTEHTYDRFISHESGTFRARSRGLGVERESTSQQEREDTLASDPQNAR